MNDVQEVHLNVPLNALQGILLKNDTTYMHQTIRTSGFHCLSQSGLLLHHS